MRIAWATPFNQRSAIGRGNAAVADELAARGHAVEIISLEPLPPDDPLPTPLPVKHWRQVDPGRLRGDYDAVVVHFGDHFPFHAGALPLLAAAPCIGVFHDLCMYNFFSGWLADRGADPTRHDDEVVATYGEAARAFAAEARGGGVELGEITARIPMVEWIARHCAGALTHARHYAGRIEAVCAGPVASAPLPWPPRDIAAPRARTRPTLTAITVGVMNRNKCAEEVIRAIAGSPRLNASLRYRLVGRIHEDEARRLSELADALDYGGLSILGDVASEVLEGELRGADIVCCLRRPVLEGASGSVIEALQSGRPTVVADAGSYAEIPDDMVFKVAAEVPVEALRAQLEGLADDEPLRRATGQRARRWANARFTAANYVTALEPLIAATRDAQPALRLAAQVGGELSTLGLTRNDPAVARLAERLGGLFIPA